MSEDREVQKLKECTDLMLTNDKEKKYKEMDYEPLSAYRTDTKHKALNEKIKRAQAIYSMIFEDVVF